MALTESTVIRALDGAGDKIKTFKDGTDHVQAVGISDESGDHVGVNSNPLSVTGFDLRVLEEIRDQVRILNMQLSFVTGIEIESGDLK